ncbi:antitoxin CptB [Povalibacter uvarum]|uniref:FAD assembly factor SdhE n=1 Tax=Povalibacter uvarum TaxID=732238 RepID=A0A841HGI8_9GAMM|nr:succinate dehydrogenase assembly factor 2 [Povalibacter uvarum]MBB6091793.1 antitoxin CptB [Povalibacter uvarum]
MDSAESGGTQAVQYPLSASIARLRWRCRRGMRELDVVLQRYLETRYTTAPLAEQQAFEQLLDEQDPQLLAYLMGRERPQDPLQANVIARLADPGV